MKLRNMVAPVVFGALTIAGTQVHAAGTLAGTEIKNTATLSYDINSVAQDTVTSEEAKFLVDVRVDFQVERAAGALFSTDLSTDEVVVAAIVLTNEGNSVATFKLGAADATGTPTVEGKIDTKNFDTPTFKFYVDNGTSRTLDPADTVVTSGLTADIAVDGTQNYLVTVPKGDIKGIDEDVIASTITVNGVTVTPTNPGATPLNITANGDGSFSDDSATGDDQNTVQIVFADGTLTPSSPKGDNIESVNDAVTLAIANLGNGGGTGDSDTSGNFTKTSAVISDPINGTNNPKAIPGATVEYTITITNSGSGDASNVIISDLVPTTTTFKAGTIKWTEHGGSETTLTDGGGDDAGDYNVTEAGKVTVNIGTLAANETDTIKFSVEIK